MHAIYPNASKHFDILTGLQFEPILIDGLFIGIAKDISEAQQEQLRGRVGFTLVSDTELEQMLAQDFTPASPSTGDPIADSAKGYASQPFNELMKLAKSRGITLPQGAKKADVIAALETADDPLGSAPTPPGGAEG